jgi:hypothetical protein
VAYSLRGVQCSCRLACSSRMGTTHCIRTAPYYVCVCSLSSWLSVLRAEGLGVQLRQAHEEAERIRKVTAADVARVAAQHAEEVALMKEVRWNPPPPTLSPLLPLYSLPLPKLAHS